MGFIIIIEYIFLKQEERIIFKISQCLFRESYFVMQLHVKLVIVFKIAFRYMYIN